ncbi:1,4-dihydroxy-2-naphthoyl-CoA hydrolase [bacterium HR39]|nr:1,4-dihydroxy-2-naphthoyl-CoA hydrolase [bacterium HR39]
MTGRPLPWTGPFQDLLGYAGRVEADGAVVLELDVGERHVNQYGVAHGGITLTLLDAAGGLAALVAADAPERVATISMATNFVRGVMPGRVRAVGRVEHMGGTVAHTRMELFDAGGRLLAEAQGAYRLFRRRDAGDGGSPAP